MMSTTTTPIAEFLHRNRLRISDLAKAGDVTWPTAQSWVKGETFPTTDHLGRIVRWLEAREITATLADFLPTSPADTRGAAA